MTPDRITQFQVKVLSWYAKNKRNLPWRESNDPYHILVSEVMLQQTQVERVSPYFKRWIVRFPGLDDLAKARKVEVLKYWSGLGYNNRALRLRTCAMCIQQVFDGRIPADRERLLTLPGIGPYTASAIMAFAFNKEAAVIDTNIRRVLIHEFALDENIPKDELTALALRCVPDGRAREWYNALMDYGALVLTAKKTGISPLTTQSKFTGSDRWLRGKIVKMLIKEEKAAYDMLEQIHDTEQLSRVITKLRMEKIIERDGNHIKIHDG